MKKNHSFCIHIRIQIHKEKKFLPKLELDEQKVISAKVSIDKSSEQAPFSGEIIIFVNNTFFISL